VRPLGGEGHQERQKSAGVGEEERRRHRADDGAAHAQSRKEELPPREGRIVVRDFGDAGGDVHRKIHHRARGGENDGPDEDILQVEELIAGVEKRLRERHRRASDVHHPSEEMREGERRDHTEHRAEKGARALLRPTRDEIHDDRRQHRDRQEGDRGGMPTGKAKRNQELPDGQTAEDEAEERLRARPAPEDDQQDAEAGEERPAPAEPPVVAGDEDRIPIELFGNDDERRIADLELLVEIHLRADLVLRGENAALAEIDLELLRAVLDESVKRDAGIIDRDDARGFGVSRIDRQPLRTRRKPKRRTRERQHHHWYDFPKLHHNSALYQIPARMMKQSPLMSRFRQMAFSRLRIQHINPGRS